MKHVLNNELNFKNRKEKNKTIIRKLFLYYLLHYYIKINKFVNFFYYREIF